MNIDLYDNVCKEELFKEVFNQHSNDLYKFLYYKYGEENNPHDLVQEAFLKLWDNCKKVTPDKARSFLFTVANNQMLNEISKQKTRINYSKEDHKTHSDESPEYVYRENEYMEQLKKALEELSEEQRVTFLLNRVEGKKHQEIADMLGISRKAVEKRIYTALRILREKVEGL
ncbi:RNA polymerase sigma factor [Mangrovivirga sp. M17]|uniref:RNA polymerase sigma factor n=1 Tax=Mangrovivirga halotolerans TaxID=2993936 RepID=A0ABT3RRV9_9BACT|nr:RNA polymerase sigma factor [Mangrovivirga halotolerans]MCX2744103.1 RNA polymerase sigma factor [Mangrovivirga halotolerans]